MGIRTRLAQFLGFGKQQPQRRGRRAYAGAIVDRLTSDWIAGSTSADAEIKGSLRKLRDRSRQMVRDNPYARQAKRTTQINVIGQGIRLQSQVMSLRGNKRDERVNRLIEEKWERWCRADYCDVAGQKTFHMYEWLACGALPESGEAIIRIHRKSFGGSKIPLALELIESDLLDEDYQGPVTAKGHEWRMGVEIDRYGRPVRYAFLTRHPGDYWFQNVEQTQSKHVFLPAKDIILLFLPERPQQHRGVPWFAPVIGDAHQLAGYEEAAVIRARSTAGLMGFVTSPEGELAADDIDNGQRITEFEPGVFKYLDAGQNVVIPDLKAPDQQYEMFVRAKTRRFASGFGCSYETLSRDFSETNYSSSRLSLLEDRDHWKVVQSYLIEHFHNRVFREWLELAVLSGELKLPDYELRPERYDTPRWLARGWSWVDPLKEAQAYALMEDRGYMTKAQICAQIGTDLDENLEQKAREQQIAAGLGISLTTEAVPASPPRPVEAEQPAATEQPPTAPAEVTPEPTPAPTPEVSPEPTPAPEPTPTPTPAPTRKRSTNTRRKKTTKVDVDQKERPDGPLD